MKMQSRGCYFVVAAALLSGVLFLAGGGGGCGGGKSGSTGSGGADGSSNQGGRSGAGSGGTGAGTGGANAGGTAGGSFGGATAIGGSGGERTGGRGGGAGSGGSGTGGRGGGGSSGAGTGGVGGAGGAGSGVSYSACTFIGGINRTVIAKRDTQRNLCVVLVLDAPGTNPFNLNLPQTWGMEFAFEMPALADCRLRVPPPAAVAASGGTGFVALPATPQATVDIDVTLTFPPADAGVGTSERLMTTGLLAPPSCL
jgi:hypothetical protein